MTWWREVELLQEPFSLSRDPSENFVDFVFNIMVIKRPSHTFIEELISYLESENIGTLNSDIFVGPLNDNLENADDPYIIISLTGGTSPERTHDSVILPAYQIPSAQILSRGKSYISTKSKSYLAYDSVVKIRNLNINI